MNTRFHPSHATAGACPKVAAHIVHWWLLSSCFAFTSQACFPFSSSATPCCYQTLGKRGCSKGSLISVQVTLLSALRAYYMAPTSPYTMSIPCRCYQSLNISGLLSLPPPSSGCYHCAPILASSGWAPRLLGPWTCSWDLSLLPGLWPQSWASRDHHHTLSQSLNHQPLP